MSKHPTVCSHRAIDSSQARHPPPDRPLATQISLNGEVLNIDSRSLEALLRDRGLLDDGIAVALNHAVLPRSQWDQTRLSHLDVVDVFRVIAGG